MHGLLGIPYMGPAAAVEDWVVWYSAFCFFLSRIGGRVFLEFCEVGGVANEMQPM
jgi:hypothetical protein